MKTKKILLIIVFFASTFLSCKSQQNTTAQQGTKYRVIVSFISKGAGIDAKTIDALSSYIKSFNSASKTSVEPLIVNWGKEGEKDYCFSMKGVSKSKQKKFVKGLQNVLQSNDLVLLLENQVLMHKERPVLTETTEPDTYRLIISFISMASGPDAQLIEAVDNYLSQYNKTNNLSLAFEKYPWGREGEFDYCIQLSELTAENQTKFVESIKVLIKDSKLVFVKENEICKHKK